MSRGGRGGGRGGRRGPDLSWDDEQSLVVPITNKPEPLFPIRQGPYFANLDPSNLTNDKGKVDERAGFDPFNDQDTYTRKSDAKKRSVPDLSGREYTLEFFPKELWSVLDPKRKNLQWKSRKSTIANAKSSSSAKQPATTTTTKRKRPLVLDDDDELEEQDHLHRPRTTPSLSPKLRRRTLPKTKSVRQKRGLDAEDDYADVDQSNDSANNTDVPDEDDEDNNDPTLKRRQNAKMRKNADDQDNDENDQKSDADENDDNNAAEDEPIDSEFEESDDGQGDDYNAENYFDTGEGDDDFDGAGGGGRGGGAGYDGGGGGDDAEGGYF